MLPPEMLRTIFANVDDKNTLYNIVITSRQFCQLVEPSLYARIVFPASSPSSTKLWKLRSLLSALETSNGRRAPYVQAFSFAATASGTGEQGLIDKVLAKTVNLKSLKLYAMSGTSLKGHSFHQSPIFTLTSLHIASTSLHEDQSLINFLESHPSLKSLHLTRSRQLENKPAFSSTSFPNLKALQVHTSLIHPFLRTSARLERLCVTGRFYWPNTAPGDEPSRESIRTLSCMHSLDSHAVILMASLFPNLEWLSGPIGMANLENLYTNNRNLRGIRFVGLPYVSSLSPDEMTPLFANIPTLQFVEYYTSGNSCYRWHRDAVAPTPVKWLCTLEQEWLADWVEDVVNVG